VRRAQPIANVLAEVIRNLGLGKKLTEQRAVVEWTEAVGGRVAEHARALKVDGGRLFVEVDSSVWIQELTLMKRQILERLNSKIGRKVIHNVHFVLGGAGPYGTSGDGGRED